MIRPLSTPTPHAVSTPRGERRADRHVLGANAQDTRADREEAR